jgi:hypothetical protein
MDSIQPGIARHGNRLNATADKLIPTPGAIGAMIWVLQMGHFFDGHPTPMTLRFFFYPKESAWIGADRFD